MRAKSLIFNESGQPRFFVLLVTFIALFQLIGIVLLKLLVPLFKENDFLLSFMVNVISLIAVLLSMKIYIRYIEKSNWRRYGFDSLNKFVIKFVIGFLLGCLFIFLGILFQFNNVDLDYCPGSVFSAEHPFILIVFGSFLRYLMGSGFEEILSTSFLYTLIYYYGFRKKSFIFDFRQPVAIIISALVFGALHGMNPNATWIGVFNIMLLGAATSLEFSKSKNLGFAIGIHLAWNFTQNVVFGLPNSGQPAQTWLFKTRLNSQDLFSGGLFGIEGSILITILLSLLILTIIFRTSQINRRTM